MTPLGRGLASLIPRRRREEADEIIDQIDTVEVEEEVTAMEVAPAGASVPIVDEEDEDVAAVPATKEEAPEETDEPTVVMDEPEAVTPVKKSSSSLFDEFEDLDLSEELPRPEKPKVTPLTLDPETGRLVTYEEVHEKTAAKVVGKLATTPITEVKKTKKRVSEKVSVKKPASTSVQSKKTPTPKKTTAPAAPEPVTAQRHMDDSVHYLSLGDIEVNPEQPRRTFVEEELDELMQSLDQHGMLQPMVVMEKDDGSGYQIIAGERRYRAAKKLGWTEVPVVIRRGVRGDRNRLELALTENVQRENLNPVEEALGYKRLNEEYGMSHEEIGQRVGKSRVAVTNMMRVLQLPAEIQRGLIDGKITVGHARAILMIPDEEKQLRFYQHVVDEGLTVRKTEVRARNIQRTMNISDPMRQKTRGRSQLAMEYDGKLQGKFGYNARVKFNHQKNRFEVHFHAFSEQEARDLCDKLLGLKVMEENVDADVMED